MILQNELEQRVITIYNRLQSIETGKTVDELIVKAVDLLPYYGKTQRYCKTGTNDNGGLCNLFIRCYGVDGTDVVSVTYDANHVIVCVRLNYYR